MNVVDMTAARSRRAQRQSDVMLGANIRVCDDDSGNSFHEGVVVAVETLATERGLGDCLRVLIHRRVVDHKDLAITSGRILVVDDAIPMHRIRSIRLATEPVRLRP
jgi:uncharacterized protein (UPF0248 family)